MRPFKCGRKGFGATQVRLDDFVGEFAMLGRIASQGTYLELIAGLKGAHDGASLLPGCADYSDKFLICTFHVQCASFFPIYRCRLYWYRYMLLDIGYTKRAQ